MDVVVRLRALRIHRAVWEIDTISRAYHAGLALFEKPEQACRIEEKKEQRRRL